MEVIGAAWRTSSYSGGNGGTCVEVGAVGRAVAVRDTKDREGPALSFAPGAWRAFTRRIKGEGTGQG